MLSYLITLLIPATVLGFVLYIVYRVLISNVEKTATFSGHSIRSWIRIWRRPYYLTRDVKNGRVGSIIEYEIPPTTPDHDGENDKKR